MAAIKKTAPKKKTSGDSRVDAYIERAVQWQEELTMLRKIIQQTELTEDFKWGSPCYTLEGANVVLLHVFKAYCAILFFKGALIKKHTDVLVQQTKNVQATRQIRFTTPPEVRKKGDAIRACIKEAIALERAGAKVVLKKTEEFEMPLLFRERLRQDAPLKKAFQALTPGRQRGYLLFFSSAKQSATCQSRIDKSVPRIMAGLGLLD